MTASQPLTELHAALQPHARLLRRLVVARVPQSAVEDVLQEISLAVLSAHRMPMIDEEQIRWLCGVASRQCALYWRKAPNEQTLADVGDLCQEQDAPVQWLLARESEEQVQQAIRELDTDQQTLLVMKYVEGLSYEKIAGALGITLHTAEYRIRVAKQALRASVRKRGMNE